LTANWKRFIGLASLIKLTSSDPREVVCVGVNWEM